MSSVEKKSILKRVRSQTTSRIRTALSLLLAVGTLVPFLFLVFNVLNLDYLERVLLSLMLFLLIVTFGSTVALYILYGKLGEIPDHTGAYVIAGKELLLDDSTLVDQDHHFLYANRILDLSGSTAEFTQEYSMKNVSSDPTVSFVFKISNQSFLSERLDAKFRFDNNANGEWIERDIRKIESIGRYEAIFEVPFPKEIAPGESFELEITANLGQWNISKSQMVQFDIHRYKRGIDRADLRIKLDKKPSKTHGFHVINNKSVLGHNDASDLDFDIESVDFELIENRRTYEYKYIGNNIQDEMFLFVLEYENV